MVIPNKKADYSRVTHPCATRVRALSFDLHVLGTPSALALSQDQTLQFNLTKKLIKLHVSLARLLSLKLSESALPYGFAIQFSRSNL